jgi:NAD(P)-dependent dehydrogenase (short-subunit alcohol dehydrogenase family)
MTGRLDGKVAVITGGASGIGEGAVRRFVEEGAACVIADVQTERGVALAAELGDAARFVDVDVTEEIAVEAAVGAAVEHFGRLDCMFNNAGVVGVIGPIADTDADAWDRTMAVLLRGVFLGIKHAARVMIPQGSGSIVSTSSTAGVTGGLGPHAYTAAKHGVVGLTKSAASELGQHGIRVNAVAPGNIVTPMTADVVSGNHTDLATAHDHIETTSPLHRAGLPVDIANVALFLASDEAAYVTGQTLVADAGQTSSGRVSRFSSAKPSEVLEAGRRRHTSGS